VKQRKNLQPNKKKLRKLAQETHGRNSKRVQDTRRLREPPHQRTTIRNLDRHLAKPEEQAITRTREGRKEDPRRVQIKRRTGESNTVPPGDHRDRRGPKTATGRFLSKESRPRLIDLALTAISISPSPTPVYLHEPETKASACTNKDETKTKERKKQPQQNNLHQ
jgi:hypothetical protein